MYSTSIRPKSKIRGSLSLVNPSPKDEGFISGKLLMTKDKVHVFVEDNIVAMVHMIYTMGTLHQNVRQTMQQ